MSLSDPNEYTDLGRSRLRFYDDAPTRIEDLREMLHDCLYARAHCTCPAPWPASASDPNQLALEVPR